MVAYSAVQASNARIASALPETIVAVFVGGTSGIGEYTLKELAGAARRPRIYIMGRSQSSFDRIAAECEEINREGRYIFVQGDLSLLRNVDGLCKKVQDQEKAINMVFWSAGSLISGYSKSISLSSPLFTRRLVLSRLPFLPFSCQEAELSSSMPTETPPRNGRRARFRRRSASLLSYSHHLKLYSAARGRHRYSPRRQRLDRHQRARH